jgi:TDG/mug DNA glycosylase family protein
MAKNGRPYNSKRPRQIATIFRRLHPRQQCSSAVATERGSKLPFSVERAPRPDSFRGQGAGNIVALIGAGYRSAMPAVRHNSFAPHVAPDTRLLILGSLPGVRSLAARQYYAHPTNQFWRLLGAVIDRPLANMPYDDRLVALREAKVGLWDVIRSAERQTSSDSLIREAEAHDLAALIATLPDLGMIAFNGGKAAAIGRKQLPPLVGVDVVDLPSSSAAHTIGLASKLERWQTLRVAL